MLFVDIIILHLASPVNAGRKEKHMVSNTRPNRRKLRRELPADEKEKIMQIIKNISGEDGKE